SLISLGVIAKRMGDENSNFERTLRYHESGAVTKTDITNELGKFKTLFRNEALVNKLREKMQALKQNTMGTHSLRQQLYEAAAKEFEACFSCCTALLPEHR